MDFNPSLGHLFKTWVDDRSWEKFSILYFSAGFFDVTSAEAKNLAICSHHRDRLGVYWRGRRKMCQVPPDIAKHDDSKMKGDRSVLKWHSIYIKQLTGATVPVGSGKKKKNPPNIR